MNLFLLNLIIHIVYYVKYPFYKDKTKIKVFGMQFSVIKASVQLLKSVKQLTKKPKHEH
jgi:hypothetical protein